MLPCFYTVPLSLAGLNACGRLFEPISAGQIFGETSFFDLDPCNTLKSHKTAKAFFGKAWRWNYRNLECLALAGQKFGGVCTHAREGGEWQARRQLSPLPRTPPYPRQPPE